MFKRALQVSVPVAAAISLSACGFGQSMSAKDVANYMERTAHVQDAVCTTKDTNGWKYSCSFTNPHDGSRGKVGANAKGQAFHGTGAVRESDPSPPAP